MLDTYGRVYVALSIGSDIYSGKLSRHRLLGLLGTCTIDANMRSTKIALVVGNSYGAGNYGRMKRPASLSLTGFRESAALT